MRKSKESTGPGTEFENMGSPSSTGQKSPSCDLSVVIPVYRNLDTLRELHNRLGKVFEEGKRSYEIIFVEDSCPDGSLEILREIARGDSRVAVVVMEKNIGQHGAILAGLTQVRGNSIVVLDADLQDPPEVIPRLLDKLEGGFAAVFGGRRGRYESLARLLTAKIFKLFLHFTCGVPADAGLFVAMTRELGDRLLHFDGSHPFLVGMIGMTKMPMASIPVTRAARGRGRSAYSAWNRLKTGLRMTVLVLFYRCRSPFRPSFRGKGKGPIRAFIGARYG